MGRLANLKRKNNKGKKGLIATLLNHIKSYSFTTWGGPTAPFFMFIDDKTLILSDSEKTY